MRNQVQRVVVAAGVAVAAVGGTAVVVRGDVPGIALPAAVLGGERGVRLVWSDEFTGKAGAKPAASRWIIETGTPDTGELEYNSRDNVGLDGKGNLVITARKKASHGKKYTSARITTEGKFSTTHGRITARVKSPDGKGLWPAFWMLGADYLSNPWPDCGEIDIMERRGDHKRRAHATIHGPGYSGVGLTKQYKLQPDKKSFSKAFHTFTIDWTAQSIVWKVDGVRVHTVKRSAVPGEWVFDDPFFLVLNLAVGGPFPGSPNTKTPFPAKMLVDYVRVYQFT
ncbi:glycosyl hydrolase family 16 [Actinocorallia herbida]|uniref:Glycosyl hydrolase family 16 n=1 Tax=Actinocorallia herbida TaxID=58109 RepID=A0A3N1CYR7_9ACTN|nr:glycoside hydrolase family 16 protein [Actinocorallia herbida]ROO86415.1 glycosyl hydrolase family 16 [Actinocorallia herbida]